MNAALKKVPAIFFQTEGGGEPVRDWLRSLSRMDKKAIGEDIQTVEFGWPLGMPFARPMGSGLHEVCTRFARRYPAPGLRGYFFTSTETSGWSFFTG